MSRPAPEPPQETLGDRIARLRRAKGWSQRELAGRVGSKGSQLSKYERGAYDPRPDLLSRIAEELETTLDYLVTGRETKTQRDTRLRDLLPALESLPQEQRDNAVEFLTALVNAHRIFSLYEKRQAVRMPEARPGRRSGRSGKLSR
ncbi:MAG TPA: helix-turn-helix transcriptional regulator [Thermoanaerobaculia bacterium]|nr:helix-turn-helix transcriptional regulator [Thermoanaerobaculia bacterium]